jgi:adenosine deaminase
MSLAAYLQALPKVELHVHLEGALRPETVLTLAQRHGVALPAQDLAGLRAWYAFTDFPHFIEIYLAVSACLRTPDDIELIAREFLAGQAAQNIRYSEVTYTAYTHYATKGLSFADQLAALNRARAWARQTLGVDMGLVIDIERTTTAEQGLVVADWAIGAHGNGVVALGLGGPEIGHPPERFTAAFERARAAGLPRVPHAGETAGPASIWGALRSLHANRLGHGVRCLEDAGLVAELRDRQIPLEVSPTSNVCLHVVPSLAEHMLPRLLDAGLYVTLNSDDPPMFSTTLTGEYQAVAKTFSFGAADMEHFVLNALRASLLPAPEKDRLEADYVAEFARLRAEHWPDAVN